MTGSKAKQRETVKPSETEISPLPHSQFRSPLAYQRDTGKGLGRLGSCRVLQAVANPLDFDPFRIQGHPSSF